MLSDYYFYYSKIRRILCKMINGKLKYIFLTIKSSFLPALCFAFGLFFFYAYRPYEYSTDLYLHYAFYGVSFLSLSVLYFINRSKPFLTLLTGSSCYLLLNNLKIAEGENFVLSPEYLWLCFLLPLNLAVFYFLPPTKLKSTRNYYLLLLTLFELAFAQNFGSFILEIPYININIGAMSLWATILWGVFLILLALDISFRDTIVNTGLFYADSALFFGLMYAESASACTTFFFVFALILCISAFLDLHHLYRYDYLSGVGSYQSYLAQANSKFPFKYTIGLICIDNREKILSRIGERKIKVLEQMLINQIKETAYEIEVFRHKPNEWILVFKNETAKHVIDYAEDIRRMLAGSEFIFADNDSMKLTVSICVSEKTRKDLNAAEVINRAHITLKKANALNSNISMKA